MKSRNKIIIISVLALIMTLISACSVTSIIRIEFTQTPNPVYTVEKDGNNNYVEKTVEATVIVFYSNKTQTEPVDLQNVSSLGLKVTGDKYSAPGDYTLKVTYGSIVISYQYQVIDEPAYEEVRVDNIEVFKKLLENDTDTNTNNSLTDRQPIIIYLASGTYSTGAITIKRAVHIKGKIDGNGKYPQINATGNLFQITNDSQTIPFVKIENIEAIGSGGSNFFRRAENITGYVTELEVMNCTISNFKFGIYLGSNSPVDKSTPELTCEKLNLINSTFTNVFSKGLYIESTNNIFVSGNTFNNCATEQASATPCVIDINLKYRAYAKVEIVGNEFNDSGRIYDPVNKVLKPIENISYAAVVAIKARADIGNLNYQTVPATLTTAIVSSNVFNRNFEYYKNHDHGVFGVNIIMFGETNKMKDVDGININGILLNNNTINDLGGYITGLKWFNKAYGTKADAAKDSLGW